MAWRPSSDNDALVDSLVASSLLSRGSRVEAALRATDRAHFVPTLPYVDAAQPLPGGAHAAACAPHMVARTLSLLVHVLRPGAAALDVGAGSGYVAAAMAAMVAPADGACVVGVEHIGALAGAARAAIAAAAPPPVAAAVRILEGDGRLGAPAFAPFDAIHVSAAVEEVPQALLDQLAPGGRLVCPVGPPKGDQFLTVVDRTPDGTLEMTRAMQVRCVPLCDAEQQLSGRFL